MMDDEKLMQTWDLRLLQRDLIARVCNHAGRLLKHWGCELCALCEYMLIAAI